MNRAEVLEKANRIHKNGDAYQIGLLDGLVMGMTARNADAELKEKEKPVAFDSPEDFDSARGRLVKEATA